MTRKGYCSSTSSFPISLSIEITASLRAMSAELTIPPDVASTSIRNVSCVDSDMTIVPHKGHHAIRAGISHKDRAQAHVGMGNLEQNLITPVHSLLPRSSWCTHPAV